MKKSYQITSTAFEGSLQFNYDEEGILVSFFNDAKLSKEHLQFLHKTFPVVEVLLERMAGNSQTLTIKLTTGELTFDVFWEDYKLKVNKPEAMKAWNQLTPDEQRQAYERIPSYNYFLMGRPNQNRMYPDTYLRGKWQNDYKQLAKSTVSA